MSKYFYFVSIFGIGAFMNAQTIRNNLYVTNNSVYATALSGGTLYIGGSFYLVGANSGCFAEADASTGKFISSFPVVGNGEQTAQPADVLASISDGSGGWYIAGNFTNVGGVPVNGLAHIRSDNTVDPNFTIKNQLGITTLAISDSILYVGGNFTSIGDSVRNNIAAINVLTGTVTSWNPDASNYVNAIAVSGSIVYAGGAFYTIGDSTRYCIAALDASTGLATSWNPNIKGAGQRVNAIAVTSSAIYVGGNFDYVDNSIRYNIAAINVLTGAVTSWNPGSNGTVMALAVSGSLVYAGGGFTMIGSEYRTAIAALDASTGLATAWNPGALWTNSSGTMALSLYGSIVYAGGEYYTGATSDTYLATYLVAIDSSTGNILPWNPGPNAIIRCVIATSTDVYSGGFMSMMNTKIRHNLAAINLSSGEVTNWDPDADLIVNAILPSGSKVYVGGDFSTIGGQTRNSVAAVDTVTGLPTSWNPNVFGGVDALAASGSIVYLGGSFTFINGQQRNYIASVDSSTGLPTVWNPNADSYVYSIVADGPVIYAGGDFFNIGDSTRHRIAALDSSTGLVTSWNPNANNVVNTLAESGNIMYVGGSFTSIGDSLRNNIAAISLSSGAATSWNPNANSFIYSIAQSNNTVYVGGDFTNIGGQTRNYIAALDPSTGIADSWNPKPDYDVKTIALSYVNSSVYFGGKFASVSGLIRPFLSGVAENTSSVLSPPVLISPVIGDTLSVVDSTLIWHSSSNADNYEVQIAKDLDFASIVVDSSGLADTIFTPHKLTKGATYYWRVRASNVNGNSMFSAVWHFVAMLLTTDVKGGTETTPKSYALNQNYPNPFNPTTTIGYQLSAFSHVSLKVYDVLGREVATLVDKEQRAGVYSVQLSADRHQLTSGVYFYRIVAGNFSDVKKLILLK